MIPDLAHYAGGLHPATFPLQVSTEECDNDILSASFTVVTLENITAYITLNGQGLKVVRYSRNHAATALSERQQEVLSGKVYEAIEALLMALSPGFETFFGDDLVRKLDTLSSDRFRQYSDTDDDDNETED
ncbi:hypothetical protein BGX28_005541 [Mortierella sp. GBA30]|nr:hypothetical protein BGX28_005541 [Mortierella sp. GBA30]